MLSAPKIFDRYEQIRPRLPSAPPRSGTQNITALTDIASDAAAFVFDAFGVLNVGDTLIEGADRRLDELRALNCQIRILTNAASYDRAGAVTKFANLGINIAPDEIITSRDAALGSVTPGLWGAIAAPEDGLQDIGQDVLRLGDDPRAYDRVDGFLFLSSSGWTDARQALLQASLSVRDRPVLIANADLVAPRDDGFSLEPGHYGHLLLDGGAGQVRFFGKPFPEVYDLVEATLSGTARDRIVMCGDTLHTDILGAAARGWRTVLVARDGLFAGHDTADFCDRAALHPDWRLPRI
ncbi:haloacid dehalogenase [Pelagivirga sediminicola]|uniref:Haloacid dehalogenase n=1 Tax=Pelagivirga sediminicola TaxID=2170575 RepID=A0A2T7G9G7_9RHOB|nr:HAD hydrolase-like protein [Pelagivirga sediminicola]PVA11055.1 haloacid dehalogenase [Pelagivirga sediminicola]